MFNHNASIPPRASPCKREKNKLCVKRRLLRRTGRRRNKQPRQSGAEEQLRIYGEGPAICCGDAFQLVRELPGLGHVGNHNIAAVSHGLFGICGQLLHVPFQAVTGGEQGVGQFSKLLGGGVLIFAGDPQGIFVIGTLAERVGIAGDGRQNVVPVISAMVLASMDMTVT